MREVSVPDLCPDELVCCGCGACVSVCTRGAVSMKADRYGFLYPQIDAVLCIRCGMCIRVCAFKSDMRTMER